MVAAHPHCAAEDRLPGAAFEPGQLEHRGRLCDRNVVEHAERADDEARKQQAGDRYVAHIRNDHVALIVGKPGEVKQCDCAPRQQRCEQQRRQCAEQSRTGSQAHPVRQVNHRVQNHCRRHQCDRDGAGPVAQGGQQEQHQHHECNDDADQCAQPAPPGDRNDHDREHRGQRDQRPRPLVVEEGICRASGRVDLAADPDMVTDCEVGLARPAAGLQERVGAPVGTGVDRDQNVHAMGTVVLGRNRGGGQHRPDVRASAGCGRTGQHVAGLGGDGAGGRVLERHRDFRLLMAGPQPYRTGQNGNADHDQCSDDDLGGHRAQRRGAGGMRVGMRVRHPQQGRGSFWSATAGSWPGSCRAARSRWPGHGPTAGSRCAGDPGSAS